MGNIFKNEAKSIVPEKKTNEDMSGKIVTNISLVKNYCPAEEYHQRYLEKR